MTYRKRGRIELAHVLKATCEVCRVTRSDLAAPSRAPKMVLCRQMFALVAYGETSASLPRIGHQIGRHHATVLYAIDCARAADRENPAVRSVIERITVRARELSGIDGGSTPALPPPPPAPLKPNAVSLSVLDPRARAELARLKLQGWSRRGLARRYEISEPQVDVELKAEIGATAAAAA